MIDDNVNDQQANQNQEVKKNLESDDVYNRARACHRLQKSYWQSMKARRSFVEACRALQYLFNKTIDINEFNEKNLEELDKRGINDVLVSICRCLWAESEKKYPQIDENIATEKKQVRAFIIEFNGEVAKKYSDLSITSHRVLFHRIVLRMARSLIRVARFGHCAYPEGTQEDEKLAEQRRIQIVIEVLLALGENLNLGNTPTTSTTKSITSRYLSTAGLHALYNLGKPPFRMEPPKCEEGALPGSGAGLKMTHYNHQAQARAIRAENIRSTVYEANSFMDEAEMLLWRARISMRAMVKQRDDQQRLPLKNSKEYHAITATYANAAARQNAALRYFEAAQTKLLEGHVALASWLELTVLRCATTADILKRLTCQYLDLEAELADRRLQENQLKKWKVELAEKEAKLDEWKKDKNTLKVNISDFVQISHEVMEIKRDREQLKELLKGEPSLADLEVQSRAQKVAIIEEFARQTEHGAFQLGHLLPVLRDEVWRGARAGVQMLRITNYICHMTNEIILLIDEFEEEKEKAKADSSKNSRTDQKETMPLIVALDMIIRSINNFDLGRPESIQLVSWTTDKSIDEITDNEKRAEAIKKSKADWEVFQRALWCGLAKWIGQIDKWMHRILPPATLEINWGEITTDIKNEQAKQKEWIENGLRGMERELTEAEKSAQIENDKKVVEKDAIREKLLQESSRAKWKEFPRAWDRFDKSRIGQKEKVYYKELKKLDEAYLSRKKPDVIEKEVRKAWDELKAKFVEGKVREDGKWENGSWINGCWKKDFWSFNVFDWPSVYTKDKKLEDEEGSEKNKDVEGISTPETNEAAALPAGKVVRKAGTNRGAKKGPTDSA